MKIQISPGTIQDVVALSQQIPELVNPYGAEEYKKRLKEVRHLILIAFVDGQPAGFKVGYERYKDGSFYSWMGGVHPQFRRLKLAKKLAEYQHHWAKEQGYRSVRMTTRNRLKAMLIFAISDGFMIRGTREAEIREEMRIDLEKIL